MPAINERHPVRINGSPGRIFNFIEVIRSNSAAIITEVRSNNLMRQFLKFNKRGVT
jgi:hypothetical protein